MRTLNSAVILLACVGLALLGCADKSQPLVAPTTAVNLAAPAVASSLGKTTIRPISDFLSTQGTFCWPDGGGGCASFFPPTELVPNFGPWTAPARNLWAAIDYAGLANAYIASHGGTSLNTTMDGTITERELPDGRAEVQVILHTRNALTWATKMDDGTLLFGHLPSDVLTGVDAGLGECNLQLVFINTAPGAQLPDLLELGAHNYGVISPDGHEMISLHFRSRSDGTLRADFGVADGTPGRVEVTQTGTLFRTPFRGKGVADGFPAELINLRVVGH